MQVVEESAMMMRWSGAIAVDGIKPVRVGGGKRSSTSPWPAHAGVRIIARIGSGSNASSRMSQYIWVLRW